MPDSIYLAMTAAEIQHADALPPKLAYMACHFSSYGTGLSNFPTNLPEGSILILNDRIPICGHDENLIAQQLVSLCETFSCPYILLDLQREAQEYTPLITKLLEALPGKIVVSQLYAKPLPCPVFLQPLPVGYTLEKHIDPWKDRQLWLDISCETAKITVTAEGSRQETLSYEAEADLPLHSDTLHCNYAISVTTDCAEFTLSRTTDHLPRLIAEGKSLGISHFVGLYQQLHTKTPRE